MPVTGRRAPAVPRVLAALAVVAVLAVPFVWLQRVDPDPGVGSVGVWHCRPGAGNPSGGQWTDEERNALGDRCRAAAATRFWSGAGLLALGVVLGGAAVTLAVARSGRTVAPAS